MRNTKKQQEVWFPAQLLPVEADSRSTQKKLFTVTTDTRTHPDPALSTPFLRTCWEHYSKCMQMDEL